VLAGRNREAIGNLLAMLHDYKPDSPYRAFMPPLVGTTNEITALGDYLASLVPAEKSTAAQQGQSPLASR
jgi:cytochrome d ubiquinol oxidase subunit I